MTDRCILFYAIRHGETTMNKGFIRGNADVPLDDQGRRDARTLAHYFKPIEISHIICSSKDRAYETAKIIAAAKDQPVHQTDSLWPWKTGDFTGLPKTPENVQALHYFVTHPTEVPPGDAESLCDFGCRLHPIFQEAADIAMQEEDPVLLVVHGSTIHELGTAIYGDDEAVLVEPGGVVAVYLEDGDLGAEAIFKHKTGIRRADTMS